MLDYHVILDLLPTLSALYFTHRFASDVKLSAVQCAILLALGLQRKTIEDVEVSHRRECLALADPEVSSQTELKLPVSQGLALFVKVVRKLVKAIEDVQRTEIGSSIPETATTQLQPLAVTSSSTALAPSAQDSLAEELRAEGDLVTQELEARQREVIDSLDLDQCVFFG